MDLQSSENLVLVVGYIIGGALNKEKGGCLEGVLLKKNVKPGEARRRSSGSPREVQRARLGRGSAHRQSRGPTGTSFSM